MLSMEMAHFHHPEVRQGVVYKTLLLGVNGIREELPPANLGVT